MRTILTLLLSTGLFTLTAQFVPVKTIQSGNATSTWLLADYDQDGDEDLFGVSRPSGNYYYGSEFQWAYYERAADGSFYDLEGYQVEPDYGNIFGINLGHAITDFDGDGLMEFVSTGRGVGGEHRLFWYRPDQGEGLDTVRSILLPASVGSKFKLADFDDDGDLDLIDVDYYGSPTRVALHENIGGFQLESKLITVYGLTAPWNEDIRPIDMDEDGDVDFVIKEGGNNTITGNVVQLLRNHNNDSLVVETIDYGAIPVHDFALADLDNDGDEDLLLLSIYSPEYQRYLPNENGSFTNVGPYLFSDYSIGEEIYGIHDFDQDGDLDLLLETNTFGQTDGPGILLENTDQGFVLRDTVVQHDYHQLIFVDVNADGLPDIVDPGSTMSANIVAPDLTVSDPQVANRTGGIGAYEDMNGDGLFDIVVTRSVKFGLGNERFGWSGDSDNHPWGEWYVRENCFHDLNGDGIVDQFHVKYGYNQQPDSVAILMNDGTGKSVLTQEIETTVQTNSYLDWDGDGDVDFIAFDQTGAHFFYLNENGNFFQGPALPMTEPGYLAGTGDINGDGLIDLLWNSYSPYTPWVVLQTAPMVFDAPSAPEIPTDHGIIHFLCSINADDLADVVFQGEDGNIYWAAGSDTPGTFEASQVVLPDTYIGGYDDLKVQDLNGDGMDELLYHRASPQLAVVAHNLQGGEYFVMDTLHDKQLGVTISTGGQKFFPHDYDQDGDLDLIVNIYDGSIRAMLYENRSEDLNFYPAIKSLAFYDDNQNGQFDPEDFRLDADAPIVTPDSLIRYVGQANDTLLHLIEPNHLATVRGGNFQSWVTTTPTDQTVTLPPYGDTLLLFGMYPDNDTPLLQANLSSGPTRCGFEVPFWLTVQNRGRSFTGDIVLQIDPLTSYVEGDPAPTSVDGETLTWSVVDLPPFAEFQAEILLQMPSVNFLGETVSFSVAASDDEGYSETLTTYQSVIACAYDPNDKLVEPFYGNDFPAYVLAADTVAYTIRFQNTGTDTAFTVRLEDQLSEQLDWYALRPVAASHAYTHSIDATGRLTVLFENILLPDSTTNEPGSQGFFKFEIPLRPDGDLGLLENTAEIYFDFNPPIVTNTIASEVVEEFPVDFFVNPPSCADTSDGQLIALFPPGAFAFHWSDGGTGRTRTDLPAGSYGLTVTDALQRTVADTSIELSAPAPLATTALVVDADPSLPTGSATLTVTGGTAPYDITWNTDPPRTGPLLEDLSAGTYAYLVIDANGCTFSGSVVVGELVATRGPLASVPIRVYPNPARDRVRVVLPAGKIAKQAWLVDDRGVASPVSLERAGGLELRGVGVGSYRLVVWFGSGELGVVGLEVI